MEKKKVIEQTNLAFEFIQKLYYEVAFLIREIEGQLAEEDEEFVIGKPSGYAITSRNSTGLEPNNVARWLIRKFSVIFIPVECTESGRTTTTPFTKETKVIFLRVILDDKNLKEPVVDYGVLFNFGDNQDKKFTKIEQLLSHMEYRENTAFQNPKLIDYEDGSVKFQGKMKRVNLFDLNSSEDVNASIVLPALKMFREI